MKNGQKCVPGRAWTCQALTEDLSNHHQTSDRFDQINCEEQMKIRSVNHLCFVQFFHACLFFFFFFKSNELYFRRHATSADSSEPTLTPYGHYWCEEIFTYLPVRLSSCVHGSSLSFHDDMDMIEHRALSL